jgi:aldehyde dehydrogenase (NAD+)
VRRSFVDRRVYDDFLAHLAKCAEGAAPLPLTLPAQREQAERLVREAVAAGGRILNPCADPGPGKEALCRPTAVADARPEMNLCREASFAPLLAVLPFDTVDQAVEMAATCPFALGASVFTKRPARAEALAARLRAGAVTVNDVVAPTVHPATPFGGRGDSGWGVTQGAEGLLEMTVPQVVSVRAGRFRPHYDLAAGGRSGGQLELVRGLLEGSHAATLGGRLRGWRRLLTALWRGS